MTAPFPKLIARCPTPIEMIVILSIACILLGLVWSPSGLPTPIGDSALDFTQWDATVEKQPKQPLDASLPIEGNWTDQFRRLRIQFASKADGRFSVQFYSSGRCGLGGSVQLFREAVVADGVVVLDRPVQTLVGDTFQRLYAVNSDGMPLLVPSAYVDQLSEDQSIPSLGILVRD